MNWVAAFTPYKRAAELVVIAAVGLYCANWFHQYSEGQQQVGYNRAKLEQAAIDKLRTDTQAKLDAINNQRVTNAEEQANDRSQRQSVLSASSGSAVSSLQHAIDGLRASSESATADANRTYAAALAAVSADCAVRYRAMAEAADGHASDSKTYQDSWPTNSPGSATETGLAK